MMPSFKGPPADSSPPNSVLPPQDLSVGSPGHFLSSLPITPGSLILSLVSFYSPLPGLDVNNISQNIHEFGCQWS